MAYGLEIRSASNNLLFGKNARLLRYVKTVIITVSGNLPGSSAPPWFYDYNFAVPGLTNDNCWVAIAVNSSFAYAPPTLFRIAYSTDTLTLGLQGSSTYRTQPGTYTFRIYRV